MKKISLIVLLFLSVSFRAGDYVLVAELKGLYSFMATDNLGNFYTVKGCELKEYSSSGVLLKTFSDKSHGDISSADVSDPLKILLFYHDFREIIFLDNTLSANGNTIEIDNLGLMQPLLSCSSYENGFWIYDQQDFQLVRFDQNMQRTNTSGNIAQLTGIDIKPNYLIEINNMVYLNDHESGILVFDKYGTYAKTLPFRELNSFQIIGDNIIYVFGSQMVEYNIKNFSQKTTGLPSDNVIDVFYRNDQIYLRDSTGIGIYAVKK